MDEFNVFNYQWYFNEIITTTKTRIITKKLSFFFLSLSFFHRFFCSAKKTEKIPSNRIYSL